MFGVMAIAGEAVGGAIQGVGARKIPLFETLADSAGRALGGARFDHIVIKENTMNRRTTLAMTSTALLCLAVGLSSSASLAQQMSLKEQLVGTWTLVSSDQVRSDGSTLKQFGANPKGINVFDANGRFFLMIASADNSKIVSNDPSRTNSEEGGGLIVESIAYYGTYTVDEADKVVILLLEAGTFPNQVGTEQKWTVTSLKSDELKYSKSSAISGVEVHQVWKRAEWASL